MQRIGRRLALAALLLTFATSELARADIFRWDNGQLIPGTEGITLGPLIDLSDWNTDARNLRFADFAGQVLSRASLLDSWLDSASFAGAELTDADFFQASLTNAAFDMAVIPDARFSYDTANGFTKEQLYSTASYQASNLGAIGLDHNNLTGWNFSAQQLRNADFTGADATSADFSRANLAAARLVATTLSGADLSGAVVKDANFNETTAVGFTQHQLYTTASYLAKDLGAIGLRRNDLSGWDFSGQNVAGASFRLARLTATDFTNANVKGATFEGTTAIGFSPDQLYSTESYKAKDLATTQFLSNDFTGWNFAEQNLTSASFDSTVLIGADLTRSNLTSAILTRADLTNASLREANLTKAKMGSAVVVGADFTDATIKEASLGRGLTKEQLYSTASYQTNDLSGTTFGVNDLTGTNFARMNLAKANFSNTTLVNSDLSQANLAEAVFRSSNLKMANLSAANLVSADFGSAFLADSNFSGASLTRAIANGANLTNANLSGTNLNGAEFAYADLTNANFSNSIVQNVAFGPFAKGFTPAQLFSTGSYKNKDLSGISLWNMDARGWDLSQQKLTGARFNEVDLRRTNLSGANLTNSLLGGTLTDANFAGAVIKGANLWNGTARGFSRDQLYTTASYHNKDLSGISFGYCDLSGWDLSGQDLTGAEFRYATVTGTNFSDAIVKGAEIYDISGFSKDMLYSTRSYQLKDLEGIGLSLGGDSDWQLSGQNLAGAILKITTEAPINLKHANLSRASIGGDDISRVDLTDAIVTGAGFSSSLTQRQLYSTASYKAKQLGAIGAYQVNMSGWNFEGQEMAFAFLGEVSGANFRSANLVRASISYHMIAGADFSFADTRGTQNLYVPTTATIRNTILYDGSIQGLRLASNETLVIRDYDRLPLGMYDSELPIRVKDELKSSGRLRLLFDADAWDSTISFQPGIPVDLGGSLELTFAAGVDVSSQIGRTFKVFDWTGVDPTGRFDVVSDYQWDTNNLYTSGEVTLIPEPATWVLFASAMFVAMIVCALARMRHVVTATSNLVVSN